MENDLAEIQQVLEEADRLYDVAQLELALSGMALEISKSLEDKNPLLLCVMNGGLVTAGQLLPKLSFPLQLDYLHATRYRQQTSGSDDVEWRVSPVVELQGRHVLIVDDILDEGVTLASIMEYCRKAGAASVQIAVLVEKLHRRKVENVVADYVAVQVPDRYVFGYGMDYKGYWRNAAGIYAVRSESTC